MAHEIPSTYYFDESGNTGDIARRTVRLDFDQQPVFVLACIGIKDCDQLANEIARLKALHKVQAAELKSASLVNKPEFISDIARHFRQRECPIFVEIVEKRFCILAHMVDRLIITPMGGIASLLDTRIMKNLFAEYLHAMMPNSVMGEYVVACASPSADAVRAVFLACNNGYATATPKTKSLTLSCVSWMRILLR